MMAPPAREKVDMNCISDAIQLVNKNLVPMILSALVVLSAGVILGVVGQVITFPIISGMMTATRVESIILSPLYWLAIMLQSLIGVFAYPLMISYHGMALKLHDKQYADVGDLFKFEGAYFKLLLLYLLVMVATFIGSLFCLIPGLIIGLFGNLVMLHVFIKKVSFSDALNEVFDACKPMFGSVVGVLFVSLLLGLAGVIGCYIGVLYTYPIFCATVAIVYRRIFPVASEATLGTSGTYFRPPAN